MDQKIIRRRLWDSLEMHYYRVILLVTAVVFAIMFFPYLGRFTEGAVIIVLVFLPFLGFYICRVFAIFRYPEQYVFTSCKLEKFHFSVFWRTAYFEILLEIPEVGVVLDETAAIFVARGMGAPQIEDYVNREVTLAYNKETGRVVVIG